jgi:hypothetical protein
VIAARQNVIAIVSQVLRFSCFLLDVGVWRIWRTAEKPCLFPPFSVVGSKTLAWSIDRVNRKKRSDRNQLGSGESKTHGCYDHFMLNAAKIG